ARATGAEGEPVLYESVWNGNAGFGPVTGDAITMQQVPGEHQATMAAVFPEDGGWGWFWWGIIAMVGVFPCLYSWFF
ncbi:MAG: hypothetical protein PPP56_12980, partial [Longimonas sp.]